MNLEACIWWRSDEAWLGYFESFPDYWTQGETFDDRIEHLSDLHCDLTSGEISGIRSSIAAKPQSRPRGTEVGSLEIMNDVTGTLRA